MNWVMVSIENINGCNIKKLTIAVAALSVFGVFSDLGLGFEFVPAEAVSSGSDIKEFQQEVDGLRAEMMLLREELAAERARQIVVDQQGGGQIQARVQSLEAMVAQLKIDLTNEISARMAADTALQSNIDAAIATEATARAAGDAAALASANGYTDSAIATEATARAAGD
ncbi:MAG: hypothetical protein ACRD38_05030, partial [Nitrososphaerales archaeon]